MQQLKTLRESLPHVSDKDAATLAFSQAIRALGFGYFDAYCVKWGTMESPLQHSNFFVADYLNVPGTLKWVERYLDGMVQLDPTMQMIAARSDPFEYLSELDKMPTNAASLFLKSAYRVWRVKRIWAIPLNTVGYVRGVTVYDRSREASAGEKFSAHCDELTLMASLLMARLVEIHDAELNPPAPASEAVSLTSREADCLHWAARGKTNWEIGQLLEISENTVRFHLKNTYKKLGARTRARAITTALSKGVLSL